MMTTTIGALLLIAAVFCFLLATWPAVASRVNLVALGLACFAAAELVGKFAIIG